MKTLGLITAASILLLGTAASHGANLDRISATTGVPVATLQSERASTGLGWGGIEKAHLLANATGQSFDNIVALHESGQGWGKIAHDNGLNLGRLVSNANRSGQATSHAQNLSTVHGKSATTRGKSTTLRGNNQSVRGRSTTVRGRSATNISRGRTTMRSPGSFGHGSSFRSAHTSFRGTRGMGGQARMGGMGHGGRGR